MKKPLQMKSALSILGLCVLLFVLVACIKGIFVMLEGRLNLPPAASDVSVGVLDADTGEESQRYTLTVLSPEDRPLLDGIEEWLERCQDLPAAGGGHWLTGTTPTAWYGALYLPDLGDELQSGNIAISSEEAEGGTVLTIYLSTLGLPEGDGRLLVFQSTGQSSWPVNTALVVSGSPVPFQSQCIYNSGQWFWAEQDNS